MSIKVFGDQVYNITFRNRTNSFNYFCLKSTFREFTLFSKPTRFEVSNQNKLSV